jgi:hypothetical protein
MPWYVSLSIAFFLFLVAPFFRKWVDLVIWPKLSDWWSSRSIRTIQRQINKLEKQLKKPQIFDDVVFRLFKSVLLAITFIAFGLVALVAALDQRVGWIRTLLQFQSMAWFILAGWNAQWGYLLAAVAQRQEPEQYDQDFKSRIERLKLRLEER